MAKEMGQKFEKFERRKAKATGRWTII